MIGCSNLISFVDDEVGGGKKYKSTFSERAKVPNNLKEALVDSASNFKKCFSQIFRGLFTETSQKYNNEGSYAAAKQLIQGVFGVFTKTSKEVLVSSATILNSFTSNEEMIERAKKIYKRDQDIEKKDLISFEKLEGVEEIDAEDFKIYEKEEEKKIEKK